MPLPPARDIVVVHSSDLHVDHDYTARLHGGDGTAGLGCVLAAARGLAADVVLLAGDTFDSHRVPQNLIEQAAAVIGASAGASGLMAAFAVIYPRQVLYMLLFFVIPLKMRASTMLWVWAGVSLIGIFIPYGNVAHAAHLGGTAMGFLFARSLIRRHRPPPVIVPPNSSLNINPAPE